MTPALTRAREHLLAILRDPQTPPLTVVAVQHLLERLRTLTPPEGGRDALGDVAALPNPWGHVPLDLLLREAGNQVVATGHGLSAGHEPVHASRTVARLTADPERGRWFCASCRRGGDAPALLASLKGLTRRRATAELIARFGRPAPDSATARHDRRVVRRVTYVG